MKIPTKMYLHSDKYTNWEIGEELGLSEEASKIFGYALYEVEFDVIVDSETGDCKIFKVNGRELK